MAHHAEPMDIDSDFDNKENSLHHNNVLPFTEKGYEELDVSELNMKLRYSITPASSPMSKSYTANCVDNRSLESGDDTPNVTVNENSTLTRSLNSKVTKTDIVVKSLKALPLQAISTEQFVDSNRNTSVLRPLDTTVTQDKANVTVTVSGPGDVDENSLLSSSSSAVTTPEAITPIKDKFKHDDGGSPIMRGLKSVLNMFRSSQSPIPPADTEDIVKPDMLSPVDTQASTEEAMQQAMLASTPISTHRKKETSPTKRNSPQGETIVFNEDLEKELQWKDETTIIFSQERIPIHKLFFQQSQSETKITNQNVELPTQDIQDDMNSTVEYMDISYNDSFRDRTMTDVQVIANKNDCTVTESDAEFVDCETTFTENNSLLEDKDKTPVNDNIQERTNENTSASRLKKIILNTTQDILDATLSITPEDLIPEVLHRTPDVLDQVSQQTPDAIIRSDIELEKVNETVDSRVFEESLKNSTMTQENLPVLNQTVDITSPSVDLHFKEDPNLTKTFEDLTEPVLNQTVEITNSVTNTKYIDPNVTITMESFPAGTIILDNQHILENLDSTSIGETIILDDKMIADQLKRPSTNNSDSNLIHNTTQDLEPNNTGVNNTNVSEHNSSNMAENTVTRMYSPETQEEIENNVLLNPEVTSSPIREASMTELAAEVPLPDEDDLEKELNMSTNITAEASALPNTLSLDLVDDIKVQTVIHNVLLEEEKLKLNENNDDKSVLAQPLPVNTSDFEDGNDLQNKTADIPEIIHNVLLEEEKLKLNENNDDKSDLAQPLPVNTSDFEGGNDLQNKPATLNPDIIKAEPEIIKDIDYKNEELLLTEETQVITVDALPETAPSLNVDNEVHNKTDHVQHEVEALSRTEIVTECLSTTVAYNSEENIKQCQEIVPMNINESIVGLKPLPDIINQTNVPNVENEISQNIPESVTLEEPAILPENHENVANEVINPEIVTEAIHNVVPELLSDVSDIVKPANELINVITEELPITSANEEIAKESITGGTATGATEDMPVATDNVTDAQLDVDVISTEPVIPQNEKEPVNTNIPVSESADIKTEENEVVLSGNNSPFVLVIAEDIPEMKPEENTDIQNMNIRLETAGKDVFTPPASPPIASKGYNFNFDEMDDPFATKTKIRLSPSLDTPTKAFEPKASPRSVEKPMPKKEIVNRRKSQPERKKPVAPKRKFNLTYNGAVSDKRAERPVEKFAVDDMYLEPPPVVALELNNVTIEDKLIQNDNIVHETTLNVTKEVHKYDQELKPEDEIKQSVITSSDEVIETDESVSILSKDSKTTSSSEQSAYYSAGASSSESFPSRNVFNIPEIDDKNFNPFATKSKMRQSPPPSSDIENPFTTKTKIKNSSDSSMILPQNDETVNAQDTTKATLPDDKMETELMEKDSSGSLSNTTTSSKGTDEKNSTIKELNTEDEDTIEGPFLEAEDLNTDEKMLDFDGDNVDMMQFNDLPTQGNDENLDNGELFIDAEAFEFLLNQNKSNTVVDSGKESLFLKFDPLFAKRMSSITSESLVASLNRLQKRQSTPTKAAVPEKEVKSPIAGPSNFNITQDMNMTKNLSEEFNEDLNITVSKPMMVVPPAVNPVTPRNKSLTPNRSNRRSVTFTSPAMAVIDRLLSLSGNSPLMHDTTVTRATREQNEADLALTQLRELLAEKEIHVYTLRSESKELKDRLTTLESHLKKLEGENQDRLKNINDLNDQLAEKTKVNKSMAAVVEEYERTIARLISEIAQDKKRNAEEKIKLINERDEQTAHLTSMEVSFSDLHSKYEKSKQVILSCKANEDAYMKSIKEFEENLTKMQKNYELLKQHATSKLNHANQELEKMNKTHEAEVLKLNAMIKRKDLHITSLEESLAQKTKANEELTAICDELINKVG